MGICNSHFSVAIYISTLFDSKRKLEMDICNSHFSVAIYISTVGDSKENLKGHLKDRRSQKNWLRNSSGSGD